MKNSSTLIKYDCNKAFLSGEKSIKRDLKKRGYKIKNFELIGWLKCAVIEIKIAKINHPEYITELTPLWEFKK